MQAGSCQTSSIPSLVSMSSCADAPLQETVTKAHASIMPQLAQLAKNMLRELDPNDELTHLRVRSAKREVMVAARASRCMVAEKTQSTASFCMMRKMYALHRPAGRSDTPTLCTLQRRILH